VRAQALVVVAVVVAAEAVVVVVLLLVTFVAWAVVLVVASVVLVVLVVLVVASGAALLRAATEVVVVLMALLPVAMLLLLLEATAAVVVALVEATATHPAPAATLGGKRGLRRFTIQPARDSLSSLRYPGPSCRYYRRLALHFLLSNVSAHPSRLPRIDYGNLESHTPFSI
jgi:hypothetical protein